MGHRKKRNFRENRPNFDMNRGFPLSDLIHNNSIRYNIIFVKSPGGFNSNLKIFYWNTYSYVVNEHPGMNEFCPNARSLFSVRVMFKWEKWVKTCPHHQLFRSYLLTNKTVPLIVKHHMSLQKGKFAHCIIGICSFLLLRPLAMSQAWGVCLLSAQFVWD